MPFSTSIPLLPPVQQKEALGDRIWFFHLCLVFAEIVFLRDWFRERKITVIVHGRIDPFFLVSGFSDSWNSPDSSSECSSQERFSLSSAGSNKAFSFVVRSQLICLFSNACLSEAFWCNFRHSSTVRHKPVVPLFANNNGWTIPPVGKKCCPRVGSVFY